MLHRAEPRRRADRPARHPQRGDRHDRRSGRADALWRGRGGSRDPKPDRSVGSQLVRLLRRSLRRDLIARRAQFVAIGVTILLGVALFGASYDAFQNLTASYQGLYDDLGFADLTIIGGSPQAISSRLAGEQGWLPSRHGPSPTCPLPSAAIDSSAARSGCLPPGSPASIVSGCCGAAALDPSRPDGVLVEQHMAANFRLEPGDTVQVLGSSGWRSAIRPGHRRLARIPLAGPQPPGGPRPARRVRGRLCARIVRRCVAGRHDPRRDARPAGAGRAGGNARSAELAVAIGAGASSTTTRADQASNAALQEDVSGFGELSLAFPLLFLGAGALAMSVLLGRMVATHRAQIGVLRANRLQPADDPEPLSRFRRSLVGLAGSIPGAILGGLAAALITGLYTGVLSIPTSVVEVRPVDARDRRADRAASPARWPRSGRPAVRPRRARPKRCAAPVPIGRWLDQPRRARPARHCGGCPPAGGCRFEASVGTGGGASRRSSGSCSRRASSSCRGRWSTRSRSCSTASSSRSSARTRRSSWPNRCRRAQIASAVGTAGVAAAEPELTVPVAIVAGSARYATSMIGLVPDTTMRVLADRDGRPFRSTSAASCSARPSRASSDSACRRHRSSVEAALTGGPSGDAGERPDLRVAGFVNEPFGTYAYASLPTVAAAAGCRPRIRRSRRHSSVIRPGLTGTPSATGWLPCPASPPSSTAAPSTTRRSRSWASSTRSSASCSCSAGSWPLP